MFWLLVFLIAILALAYRRASIRNSAVVLAGVILGYGLLGQSLSLFLLLVLLWVAVSLPLSVAALRQEWFSRPAFNAFRRGLRELPTETTALLEAGGAGCDAQLFSGAPDWPALRALPPMMPTSAQLQTLDQTVDPACAELLGGSHAASARQALLTLLRGDAPVVEPDDARAAGDATAVLLSLACVRIGAALGAGAWPLAAAGPAGWLQLLRDEAADGRRRELLDGAEATPDALAVASCGLDPARDPCGWASVARAPAGDEDGGPGLRLSLRPGVRATQPAAHYAMLVEFAASSAKGPSGSACLILPADAAGLHCRDLDDGRVALSGEAIFVPLAALVGGARRIGDGSQRLACASAMAQAVQAPALRLGAMLPLALGGAARARLHPPFLPAALEHGAVRLLLAENATDLYAADALREMVLSSASGVRAPATLALIADQQTAALAARIAARRFDHGGALALLLAQATVPAPSALAPMQLGLRALGRCHPHLRRELDAARAPQNADTLQQFDEAFWAHVGHVQSNAVRSLLAALGAGALLPTAGLSPSAARCQRRLDRASANLAFLADLALFTLRGRVLRNDALLAAIGEALGVLQRACAVLWRAQRGDPGDTTTAALLRLATAEALETAHDRFDDIIRELPRAYLRGLARALVFPLGRWRLPLKEGDHDAAARWLCDGAAARQFAPLLPAALPEPAQRLRRALEATLAGEPLASRLEGGADAAGRVAERIDAAVQAKQIDASQAAQLRDWLHLCDRIEDGTAADA